MYKEKIVVNTIIKDIDSIKLNKIDKNTICYSGLYIIDTDFNQIEKIIKSKNFIKYIKLLKKYKANGYYTFSSKDLEKYINFFYK
jgi:adenine-specific DNA-methyltransferase